MSHVKNFVELLDKNIGKAHLHILVFDNSKPDYLNDLLAKNNPAISFYTVDHQENADVKVTSLQAYEHTVVVDGFGTVVSCGKFEEYSTLEKVVQDSQQPYSGHHIISPELLKVL